MRMTTLICSGIACLMTIAGIATASESTDPHAAHKKMMQAPSINVQQVDYAIPDVNLVDTNGDTTNLRALLSGNDAVVVNFIFTTCTTICPVITATTLQLQRELNDDPTQPLYVTISIDPDYDSSEVLREYAKTYGADWTFLTGSSNDVTMALRAFDAYRGNKVNHFALTLMRATNDVEWTRVEGLTSANELARIWREALL